MQGASLDPQPESPPSPPAPVNVPPVPPFDGAPPDALEPPEPNGGAPESFSAPGRSGDGLSTHAEPRTLRAKTSERIRPRRRELRERRRRSWGARPMITVFLRRTIRRDRLEVLRNKDCHRCLLETLRHSAVRSNPRPSGHRPVTSPRPSWVRCHRHWSTANRYRPRAHNRSKRGRSARRTNAASRQSLARSGPGCAIPLRRPPALRCFEKAAATGLLQWHRNRESAQEWHSWHTWDLRAAGGFTQSLLRSAIDGHARASPRATPRRRE